METPYELACQYIRLSDHIRVYRMAGLQPTSAMEATLVDLRYHLDKALVYQRRQIRNNSDWNDRVKAMRLPV